jgi:Terminase small subunit
MPTLSNSRHELFTQFVAKGLSATEAYTSAGYAKAGAAQNASRLMANDKVSARIEELKRTICDGVVQLEIRERSARIQILQNSADGMRRVIATRAYEYADHPGGATGLLVRDYRGKNAEKEVWRFDAPLMSQLNDVLKQAAIEEGQWTEKRDLTNHVAVDVIKVELRMEQHRIAEAKKAAQAKGLPWPPPK